MVAKVLSNASVPVSRALAMKDDTAVITFGYDGLSIVGRLPVCLHHTSDDASYLPCASFKPGVKTWRV